MKATLKNGKSSISICRRIRAILVLTALAICFFAMPITAKEVYTGEPVDLELADADLETVLAQFSVMTGFVFAIDPQTAAQGGLERSVTVLYDSTPWDQAVDEMLSNAGLEWSLEGGVLWIFLPGNGPTGDRNFTGEPIKLRLEDADIRDVLATFSKITGYSIEVDPQVQGQVSVRVYELPWDQVLDLILTISGLGHEVQGETLQVFQETEARGRQLLN